MLSLSVMEKLICVVFSDRHTMEMDETKRYDPLEGVSMMKPSTWKRIPHNLRSWRDAFHN